MTCQATDLAGNGATKTFAVRVVKSGPLSIGPGQSAVITQGTTIGGQVTVQAGGSLIVQGGNITGPVTGSDGASIRICGSSITGPLTITGDTGSVVVGDGAACAGNTIAGPARLTGNQGGLAFDGNVNGPLTITGNSGTVEVVGNTVSGKASVQP